MNILDKIILQKRIQVEQQKKDYPIENFSNAENFSRKCFSLIENLQNGNTTGIIAEFKRKSPSKGFINKHADVLEVTKAYTNAGAAALSIITDYEFFGGLTIDLIAARENNIPILRKDFIVDEYQIAEAKAIGADVILLIAACLSVAEVKSLAAYATSIGLEVLLELHDETELNHICDDTVLVGINNRNLKDFKVDINAALAMAKLLPDNKVKIAESGISNVKTIKIFSDAGYKGYLIGENFMKKDNPGVAFSNFVNKLK
jgi:indole-3-glycerol phosphate synthase